MKQGFTLIELMIVIALIFMFSSITFPVSYSFFHKSALKDEARNIESSLRKAQSLAITGRGDSSAGVKFSQDDYTVFEGESYEDRRASKDLVIAFPIAMSVEGMQEVVFQKTTGLPIFTGMIGHWDFNETAGNVVYDSDWLYQDNGTVYGTWATTTGKDGICLELNGNAYVNAGNNNNLNLERAITLSAWINIASAGNGTIIKKGYPSQGQGYSLSLYSGHIVFALGDGYASQNLNTIFNPELFGQWVYLAAVWDGETMKQYINGKEQPASKSFAGSVSPSEEDLIIGESFAGKIDDVRLYNYPLSDKDLEANYLIKTDDMSIILRSEQKREYIIINAQGKIEAISQ